MTILESTPAETGSQTKYAVIDTDVHPDFNLLKPEVMAKLSPRWREYIADYGLLRMQGPIFSERPRHREFAHRWDTTPPDGGQPMSNIDFAREQLLDRFDMSGALVNDIGAYQFHGRRNQPRELAVVMCTALNEYREEYWFAHDPRWFGSINIPYELPDKAVEEIVRRMEGPHAHQWKQVAMVQDLQAPMGNEKYWPIYEAAAHYNLPIALHVAGGDRQTPSGSPTYYFEEHIIWAAWNMPTVSSLVFEGTFDRIPNLKIAFIEFGWSWAVPLAWRLDASHNLFKSEVPHLQRKPSEYIRDHLWFSTQPMEEPEVDAWADDVFGSFEASGMADKIMYSSDYPHWDFDDPYALPADMSENIRRGILGENASKLYDIPLRPDSGVTI